MKVGPWPTFFCGSEREKMRIDPSIKERLAALVAEEGLVLVATEIVGSGAKTVLRLVIDGPDGVNLDQCAAVSRQASVMLDVEDPIAHRYTLEVSSPGLDRKLYCRDDYEHFAGQSVVVRMQPTYREHRRVSGELLGLVGDDVRIGVAGDEVIQLPLDQVFEARLEVDWNSVLKKGKSRP